MRKKDLFLFGGIFLSGLGVGLFWSPAFLMMTENLEQHIVSVGLLTMFVGACLCLASFFLDRRENELH